MPKLKINDQSLTITIDTAAALPLRHAIVAQLLEQLAICSATCPIRRLVFEMRVAEPGVYDYFIELTDGRLWRQVIYAADPQFSNYRMTYAIVGKWSASEVAIQRGMRDGVLRLLIRNFGLKSFVAQY